MSLALRGLFAGQDGLALGRSTIALIAPAVLLLSTLLFTMLALWAFIDRRRVEAFLQWLDGLLAPGNRLLITSLALFAGFLLLVVVLGVWQLPAIHEYAWYASIFRRSLHFYEISLIVMERVYPLLLWSAALLLQSLLALVLIFSHHYRQPGFWDWQVVSRTVLLLCMVGLSVLQWSILALQVSMRALLPGWYWAVFQRPFSARHLVFLGIVVLAIGVVTYALRRPQKAMTSLLLLTGLGVGIVFSFGYIQGQGAEYVRLKYARHESSLLCTDSYGRISASAGCNPGV